MYESEVNGALESIDTISSEVALNFTELRGRIELRSLLAWGEHCTECVWPTCYQTCDLYSPRIDGNCRQFVDGMVRVDHKGGLSPYLLKLRFKRWGKLWTVGSTRMVGVKAANRSELINIAVGAVGQRLPLPGGVKQRVLQKINYVRRRNAEAPGSGEPQPDYFLLECYNPATESVPLTVTFRNTGRGQMPFQRLVEANQGYSRAQIGYEEILSRVDMRQPFEVEITPNCDGEAVLYFGLMEFVRERRGIAPVISGKPSAVKIKCVVWDLDHTIWDGTLIEDGIENLRLRRGIVEVLREMDERGILHSIASKNNSEDALQALRHFGIDEYFLYPQIGWRPKSMAVSDIAQLLNIGLDTMAFIDDQPFEREEVQSSHKEVLVLDASEYLNLPRHVRCEVPISEESRNRRAMYRQEEKRVEALRTYEGDYTRFLRECQIQVSLQPLLEHNLVRVFELAQRTNQLNFSGRRYSIDELRALMNNPEMDSYVIECRDRFGSYGIVGFAVVDVPRAHLLDLMFSCRVQGKRIEHAVLTFLLRRYLGLGAEVFSATYRRTKKNGPGGRVFEELGFTHADQDSDGSTLKFRAKGPVADDGVISVVVQSMNHPEETPAELA